MSSGTLFVAGLYRESYEYMYSRPWSRVVDFYADFVRAGGGAAGLAKLFGKDEVRKNKHLPPCDSQVVIFRFARFKRKKCLVSSDYYLC